MSVCHSCVLELLGICLDRDNIMIQVKTGQAGQGQDSARTRADAEWGWQSRLGLDAEQGHI